MELKKNMSPAFPAPEYPAPAVACRMAHHHRAVSLLWGKHFVVRIYSFTDTDPTVSSQSE